MIKESAIFFKGKVYTGRRHCDILCDESLPSRGYLRSGFQGFITDEGIFLDRYEALTVASKCNQLIWKHPPYDQLMSEDLY